MFEACEVQQGQCNNDSQVNVQEWILPGLSGEVECLVEDLQAEQEQGTQALSGVARHQPVHLQPVQKKHQKYLEKGPKEDKKYLQKEQETHLEKFLKQRRQLGKNESERVQQIIGVTKR